MDKKSIKKQVKATLNNYNQIKLVFIFGSFTDKGFNENSDIDLALIYNKDADKFEKFNLKLKFITDLKELVGRNVDIVDFASANLKFKHQILNGKLIYCIDQKRRVRLEKEAISNYIDMKRFYDIYEKNLGKKF